MCKNDRQDSINTRDKNKARLGDCTNNTRGDPLTKLVTNYFSERDKQVHEHSQVTTTWGEKETFQLVQYPIINNTLKKQYIDDLQSRKWSIIWKKYLKNSMLDS